MGAVARLVREGLGHHGRDQALVLGVALGHEAEEGQAVAGGQGVGIGEIELELAVGVLVVEGIEVPAQIVDGAGHAVEPGEVADEACDVVAGLGEGVGRVRHLQRSVGGLAEQEDLALDAELEVEAEVGRLGEHALQRHAGRQPVGLAPEGEVGRHPGELGLPGQLDDVGEVRHGGELVLVRLLAEPVERVAGVALRSVRHVPEMGDRHDLALLGAVDVDIGPDAVADAAPAEVVQDGLHGIVGGHDGPS